MFLKGYVRFIVLVFALLLIIPCGDVFAAGCFARAGGTRPMIGRKVLKRTARVVRAARGRFLRARSCEW